MADQKNELSLVEKLDAAAQQYSLEKMSEITSSIQRSFAMAEGVTRIHSLLSDDVMRASFMPLQNKDLGFRTDKPEGGYPVAVVRQVLTEALMHGALPILNEVNIIKGRLYLAKQYFKRKIEEFPGLTEVYIDPGLPQKYGQGAAIEFDVRWTLKGKKNEAKWKIPIIAHGSESPDAIIGKGYRKAYARLYGIVSGSKFEAAQDDLEDTGITVLPTGESVDSDGVVQPEKVNPDGGTLFDNAQPQQQPKGPLSELKTAVSQQAKGVKK